MSKMITPEITYIIGKDYEDNKEEYFIKPEDINNFASKYFYGCQEIYMLKNKQYVLFITFFDNTNDFDLTLIDETYSIYKCQSKNIFSDEKTHNFILRLVQLYIIPMMNMNFLIIVC